MPSGQRYISPTEIVCMDAVSSATQGTAIPIPDARHVMVTISTASSADGTIKCQTSNSVDAPTWGSAASATNRWDYTALYDENDATVVDGDTGVVYSGTDSVQQFMLNTEGKRWINFDIDTYVAGAFSVHITTYTNL